MKNLHDWGVSEEQLSTFVTDKENTKEISKILNDAFDKIKNHKEYDNHIDKFGELFRKYVKSSIEDSNILE